MSVVQPSLDPQTQALKLPGAMAPEIADAFLRTIWTDALRDQLAFQTEQQPVLKNRALEVHGRHYRPLLALHWGLTARVAERLEMDLLPSFAWFRVYFEGDICRIHSDRPACEVSLSLLLGSSDGLPWSLDIGTRPIADGYEITDDFGDEPFESFDLGPGDAVLYFGSRRRHGRLAPNPNRWSAHLFLQWVERGGAHAGEAFEGLTLGDRPRA